MTDLDDRLTDLLTRSGSAVDVHPDLDAVLDDEQGSPVVDRGRRRRDVRRPLAVAAGVLAVLGIAGAVVLVVGRADDRDRLDVVTEPPVSAAYPVLDLLPEGIDGTVVVADVEEVTSTDQPAASPRARAVVGRVAGDGSVEGLVLAEVGVRQGEDDDAGEAQVVVSGDEAATATFEGLTPSPVVATIEDGRPTLSLDELPPGVEVLVEPGPSPTGPVHQAEVFGEPAEPGDDGGIPPRVTVHTGGDVPLAELAEAGGAEPVDVGGRPGWHVPRIDGGLVGWTTANGTNVLVDVAGLGPDDDLLVARGLRLVVVDEWLATYPDGPRVTESLPTTTGPEATPASAVVPDLVGLTTDAAFARLRAAGFTGVPALVTSRYLADASVPAGAVTAQGIEPGTAEGPGMAVPIDVSAGGPVVRLDQLPTAAIDQAATLDGFDELEPILLVTTSAGDAYKTDDWLFGPCAAVDLAFRSVADPEYGDSCY